MYYVYTTKIKRNSGQTFVLVTGCTNYENKVIKKVCEDEVKTI